ncbi:PREDICTED: protein ARABIDOPSIS THALIANA ANTHER 7 [Tarenaya hassleriana]|uniref:protein ARABIDOPSIS THALIANA ANTHER 7 n=1 Tax=Tarenaya hassleriana TaxID=28532 RepID=UPI00053CA430|nr:PREDICTED: protein ARABIDOPSIS THALIANA ANTHER 7 [Tarenaya hassleriana]
MPRTIITWLVAMATMVSASNQVEMNYLCEEVFENFAPCMGFVEGIFRRPSPECCGGVKRLNKLAKATEVGEKGNNVERVCECIEIMGRAQHLPFLGSSISDLPSMCSLHLSFPVSVAMDCSRFRNKKYY